MTVPIKHTELSNRDAGCGKVNPHNDPVIANVHADSVATRAGVGRSLSSLMFRLGLCSRVAYSPVIAPDVIGHFLIPP